MSMGSKVVKSMEVGSKVVIVTVVIVIVIRRWVSKVRAVGVSR